MLNRFCRVTWSIDGDSQTGPIRDHNEDCIAFCEHARRSYAIVCDGVGGHNGGEVASHQATAFIAEKIAAVDVLEETKLRAMLQQAHMHLCQAAEQNTALRHMATTVVLAVQRGGWVWLAWVGDSRAYRLSGDGVKQLTQDHSFVAEKVAQGVLSEVEANNHPMANTITSALGGKRNGLRHRGVIKLRVKRGDALLLMSDGVYGVLSDTEIAEAANAGARALTSRAIACGSQDNASAIVIRCV
ncbi:PP2C family serine/threonine-protein phosphatase [Zhongshania sp.]|uniref:PP2C family protein-serine/threonine phosphatase n=1 Tax=Zhongshania sp. TaxID=1971902 RepID=UPI003561B8BC